LPGLDFDRLTGASAADTELHPRDIFEALPARSSRYEYLRDVQREVFDGWFDWRTKRDRASQEAQIELEVSRYIGAMPFLWLSVPGRADRGYIERNSIALLSCLTGGADTASASWLGRDAARAEISESFGTSTTSMIATNLTSSNDSPGLWNGSNDHIHIHIRPTCS
jgi:hypothetical protein